MSDLREIGARAWHEDEDHVWECAHPLFRESVMEAMDKAIIAIEPHLRRKHRQELLDELSKSATDMAHDTLHRWGHSDTDWFDVADWIQRFAKEAE